MTQTTRKNTLSVTGAIEAHKLHSDTAFVALLEIEVVDSVTGNLVATHRYANNTENLTVENKVFTAGKFDITVTEESGKVGEVNLTVNDYSQGLQSLMEQYGGGVGSRVRFLVVNSKSLQIDAEEFFNVTGATSQGYVQSFTLGAENVLALTFPRRRQTRDFCQWRYKDQTTCRYNGSMPSCDLTLNGPNGCEAHGNTINFGAYPGLNSNGYRYV